MNQELTTVPVINLTVADVEKELLSEVSSYHALYSPLFKRWEQREQSELYMNGLLSDIPNKSVESMVLHREGDNPNAIRSGQQLLSQGAWTDGLILERHWQEVDQLSGNVNGVLIVDGSDFPKQGMDSIGVKRQYCGDLGKKTNCQAGVYLGYGSSRGYTLLDRRLYLPEEWFEDQAYAVLRKQCGFPADIVFQTKPQLAGQMVKAIHGAVTLRFRWLTCDAAFGRDTAFLDSVGEVITYLAEVDFDTRVWLQRPAIEIPTGSGLGRSPTRYRLVKGEPTAQTVAEVGKVLATSAWQRLTVKEGSKGPLVADFVCPRVVARRNGLPGLDLWLVCHRHPETHVIEYYLSNAPLHTSIETFAWLSGMRWPIKICFEEGKQELGMGTIKSSLGLAGITT
ncbi:MAG: IS701 family transposase [Chloroflexota bacterium]